VNPPMIPPIRKELVLPVDPATAFRAFTEQVQGWWPVATHSVSGTDGRGLRLNRDGFVETLADGSECRWGSVLAWDPPHRLEMTWHPGEDANPCTLVEVTFDAVPAGTLVRLTHSGWEALKLPDEQLRGRHGEYRSGWDTVLGAYEASAAEVGVA
jgi:uncharacterized protein YndB with AHSA1/START domain